MKYSDCVMEGTIDASPKKKKGGGGGAGTSSKYWMYTVSKAPAKSNGWDPATTSAMIIKVSTQTGMAHQVFLSGTEARNWKQSCGDT
jgi:hypothetical protein